MVMGRLAATPVRVYCKMVTTEQIAREAQMPPVSLVWINRATHSQV